MKVYGYLPFGYEGALVMVEADLRKGIPAVDIVGLADGSVKEARERVKAAIKNSGFDFPEGRVLISLSPADLKKEGAAFDLAIALEILDKQNPVAHATDPWLCYAELELSGKLRPIRGTYAALESAKAAGITKAIVSADVPSSEIPDGVTAYKVDTLKAAYHIATLIDNGKVLDLPRIRNNGITFPLEDDGSIDKIQDTALLRAMMIAAAGRHHLLAIGKPGCGKTLALQHFQALLPALTVEESQSVTRIHSLAGLLPAKDELVKVPPFRWPHQTASMEGICGGGVNCRPGEISLAHNGVLFLDEAAEFRSSVLQMLRVPMGSGNITLCRAGRSTTYPAKFQLLMTANPCPCGNYGEDEKICLCSGKSVEQYWNKFSAPLLDRIAIRVHATGKDDGTERLTLEQMRKKIARATEIQRKRGMYNQHITPTYIGSFCTMADDAKNDFEKLTELSPRGQRNVLVVARTISDLDGIELIQKEHIEEAVKLATWEISL